MKNLIIFFLIILYGCTKNPERVEKMPVNNGQNYVKNYFKNNSKIKMEIYNTNDNKILIEKQFDKKITTKFIEYYSNGSKKLIATLLNKPNFFEIKNYYENGKIQSDGSVIYDEKTNKLIQVSDWLFYNKQTGEADSIGHYFSDGNVSILAEVERIDNKNKKIVKIKYFDVKPKDTTNNSINWEVKKNTLKKLPTTVYWQNAGLNFTLNL